MRKILREDVHCRKCGSDLTRGVERCPYCGYNPRESGFKLGGLLLLATVVFFSISVFIGNYYPYVAAYTIVAAFIGFIATTVVVLIAFSVKPYHLATFFE